MRTLIVAFVTLIAVLAGAATAQEDGYFKLQKVVYHVNGDGGEDGKAYLGALRNIQNHIDAVGAENLEAAVVMHGDGLGMLMRAAGDQRLQSAIASLKEQKVRFLTCRNTLESRQISWEDDLFDVWEEDIVPSGVAELSRLQQMGYTYIKP